MTFVLKTLFLNGLLRIFCDDFHHQYLNNNTSQRPFFYKKLYSYFLQKVMCIAMIFRWGSTNFLFLKKIPGAFVLRMYTREISKLQEDILKEKIFTCYVISMLVENRTLYSFLYFRKQPRKGVPKN